MTRVIVFTGKGGVGKTSIAAATSLLCAKRGQRTLVVSTDVAHSLGDAFGRKLGPEPIAIGPNLEAQETDVYHILRDSWGAIQQYFASVFQWRGLDDVLAEEMTVLPGLDELASLLQIVDHHEGGRYDVIIVDAAPTGETIRLLSLPEAARFWLDRVLPMQRRATQIAGPMIRRITGMPMPDETVFRAGEDLFRKLDRMHKLLTDPYTTSLRIVLNLEKMVIAEAQRSFTYFHLFGYPTDLVICNRVLPEAAGRYFAEWREAQQRYWPTVQDAFAPVPVRQAPLLPREVLGVGSLTQLAADLYGDEDPSKVFYSGKPYRVERENGGFALSLELPFATKEDVDLLRRREELVVQVGPWRRNLILPRVLIDRPTGEARFAGGTLTIHFGEASGGESQGGGER